MNPEITKLIEQYLNGELSAADKQVFEQRLAENDQLLHELLLQRQIHEGAKRAAQRETIKQTAKHYHFRKKLINGGIAVVVLSALTAAAIWLSGRKDAGKTEGEPGAEELLSLIEQIDSLAPMENIPTTYFNLGKADTVVLSPTGVLLSVPESAFLLNGKPYHGSKVVQWQEAVNASDIVKAGLSTTSDNRLLETQGMFGMQAFTSEGKQLDVNPKVGVYVQVPVDELKAGMQLFEGKRMQNGQIDWQNPQPLEKLPVPASMTELDFYPPGYENKLNALKWKTGKKERDSLYLSFEEENLIEEEESSTEQGIQAAIPRAVHARDTFMYAVASTSNTRKKEKKTRVYRGFIGMSREKLELQVTTKFESNYRLKYIIEAEFQKGYEPIKNPNGQFFRVGVKDNPKITFKHVSSTSIGSHVTTVYVVDLVGEDPISLTAGLNYSYTVNGNPRVNLVNEPIDMLFEYNEVKTKEPEQHIPPSKVLAFWKPKFDQTILATRDFEQRMKAVHTTCNKRVLEAYVNQLNKPLWQIDEQVAAMGYPDFRAFAAERVGGIELDNPHMNNLRQFYEKSIADLRKELKKDRNYVRNLEKKWDTHLQELRTDETSRTTKRNAQNYQEEYDLNMASALQQLGMEKKKVGFTIRKGGKPTNAVTNVYNLDRFVADVTTNRTTGTFTDPNTGKKATITYNPFTLSVDDHEKYGKLFVYLFPHELNSFQRIGGKNGTFDYPLNDGISYDMVVVGINEEGYFLYEKSDFNKGELGTVKPEKVSEKEFNSRIEALNSGRMKKPMKISEELEWLTHEQQDYKVQRLRKEMEAFRNELRPIVFPCLRDGVPQLAEDTEINF